MSSIMTNNSAMNALATLRNTNTQLDSTQNRISTGLKVQSGKDNAAYFQISEKMKGDSAAYNAINEGLTMTKNSVATARLGSETLVGLASDIQERVAFAQAEGVDRAAVKTEIDGMIARMETTLAQSTFNGNNLVAGTDDVTVVTGISRAGTTDTYAPTTMTFKQQDLATMVADLKTAMGTAFTTPDSTTLAAGLDAAEAGLSAMTASATAFGVAEKSIEDQQEFLTKLTDNIDSGVGSMVDANMEEEAARLQALQVQQQLATQSLSIANQAPQNLLSLFQ